MITARKKESKMFSTPFHLGKAKLIQSPLLCYSLGCWVNLGLAETMPLLEAWGGGQQKEMACSALLGVVRNPGLLKSDGETLPSLESHSLLLFWAFLLLLGFFLIGICLMTENSGFSWSKSVHEQDRDLINFLQWIKRWIRDLWKQPHLSILEM